MADLSVMTDSTLPIEFTAAANDTSRPFRVLVPRLIAGIVILSGWEILVRSFAPPFVAKPSGIAMAIPRVLADPAFAAATASTLGAVAEGLAIALVFGTIIGLCIGRSIVADRLLRHYVNSFYAMPMVVVVPLFALWFGYSGTARLATIVFAAVFSIIVNVADGARAVPREYTEVARAFRSGRLRALLDVVLPAATPYFLAGFRLAAGRALIGAVIAEYITAVGGLGYFILYNSRTFHHNEAFVGVLVLAAFGVAFEGLIAAGTRSLLPWYRRDEQENAIRL
jgi:ABC-type nitrate/sulfonate/bicarbonate transport system permease component